MKKILCSVLIASFMSQSWACHLSTQEKLDSFYTSIELTQESFFNTKTADSGNPARLVALSLIAGYAVNKLLRKKRREGRDLRALEALEEFSDETQRLYNLSWSYSDNVKEITHPTNFILAKKDLMKEELAQARNELNKIELQVRSFESLKEFGSEEGLKKLEEELGKNQDELLAESQALKNKFEAQSRQIKQKYESEFIQNFKTQLDDGLRKRSLYFDNYENALRNMAKSSSEEKMKILNQLADEMGQASKSIKTLNSSIGAKSSELFEYAEKADKLIKKAVESVHSTKGKNSLFKLLNNEIASISNSRAMGFKPEFPGRGKQILNKAGRLLRKTAVVGVLSLAAFDIKAAVQEGAESTNVFTSYNEESRLAFFTQSREAQCLLLEENEEFAEGLLVDEKSFYDEYNLDYSLALEDIHIDDSLKEQPPRLKDVFKKQLDGGEQR